MKIRSGVLSSIGCLGAFAVFALAAGRYIEELKMKRPARTTACLSNLKQIAAGLQMYVVDYDDRLPPHATFDSMRNVEPLPYLLHPYLKNTTVWRCPSDRRSGALLELSGGDTEVGYGYNFHALSPGGRGVRLANIHDPGNTVLFADSYSYLVSPGPPGGTGLAPRHLLGVNVCWADGRAKRYPQYRDLLVTAESENGASLKSGIDSYLLWNLK